MKNDNIQEKKAKKLNGFLALILHLVFIGLSMVFFINAAPGVNLVLYIPLETDMIPVLFILNILLFTFLIYAFKGYRSVKPNEAFVLSLFGKYYGTLKDPGFYFINPFTVSLNPAQTTDFTNAQIVSFDRAKNTNSKGISLKIMTLNNEKQKINDLMGNPIIIGIVVIWNVIDTAKAVFNVDNYKEFLTIQCDSSLRNIVRLYPYDTGDNDDHEKSLRGSSVEIAKKLKEEIQAKVDIAGLEIREARITHLSYASEIAAAMLQRQQASAVIDARQMIVEGAVGMVDMALEKLKENNVVDLDEERKAAMVSNLLVVLCGSKDTQPIINSGSIY